MAQPQQPISSNPNLTTGSHSVSEDPEPIEGQPPSNKQTKTIPILIAIILILLAIMSAGFYLTIYKQLSYDPPITPPNDPAHTPQPTPSPDPTANWQTYSNEQVGYTFKYPSDWEFQAYSEGCGPVFWVSGSNKKEWLTVCGPFVLSENNTLTSLAQQSAQNQTLLSRENITVDGKEGLIQELQPSTSSKQIEAYIGGLSVEVSPPGEIRTEPGALVAYLYDHNLSQYDTLKTTLTQILSTFEFIDQESNNTGGTCKSINLDISITLPNQTWNCQVDNAGREQLGWDGTITATSDLFTVMISSFGRGPYCTPPETDPNSPRYAPQEDPSSCQISLFYTKGREIELDLYKSFGENKEIYGAITSGRIYSLSALYAGMESRDLSNQEKAELTKLLDSISFIN